MLSALCAFAHPGFEKFIWRQGAVPGGGFHKWTCLLLPGCLILLLKELFPHSEDLNLSSCYFTNSEGRIAFPRFIYETEHHNGIAELLEILGR